MIVRLKRNSNRLKKPPCLTIPPRVLKKPQVLKIWPLLQASILLKLDRIYLVNLISKTISNKKNKSRNKKATSLKTLLIKRNSKVAVRPRTLKMVQKINLTKILIKKIMGFLS